METRTNKRKSQPPPPRNSYSHPTSQHQYSTPSSPTAKSSSRFSSSRDFSNMHYSSSTSQTNYPTSLETQHPSAFISAPLPSPTNSHQPSHYFGSLAQAQQQPHPSQQQSRIPLQGHQAVGAGGGGAAFLGQRGGQGGNAGLPETAPFLNDFNLVAEAAKRAQMACLSRDLGDVGL